MSDKTIVNNWDGGGTLQTWADGEWQILYAKDSTGSAVTLSLTSHDAVRLAYAVSPIPSEYFERAKAANHAVYELSYPGARADELRQIAKEIDCGGGCEGCGPQKQERGEFCGFIAADSMRSLAAALDLKAKAEPGTVDPATNPRVTDNDKDEITVTLNGRELRGWSYANDGERRQKMLQAREYVEGWRDALSVPPRPDRKQP